MLLTNLLLGVSSNRKAVVTRVTEEEELLTGRYQSETLYPRVTKELKTEADHEIFSI